MLALAGAVAFPSCSEDWDNHYQVSDQVSQESMMELLKADPQLSTFAHMVEIAGYDELLGSSQTFTVFAPTNDALAGVDLDDVDAVKRIVLNHFARFNNTTASANGQSVKMYNGKRHSFDGKTFAGITLDPQRSDIIGKNGILHVLEDQIPYAYNFREYIQVHANTSKFNAFLNRFDELQMDLSASRPIGVDENGATVYDSVLIEYNPILQHPWYGVGDIADEDSTFTMIIPDDTAWEKAYNRIRPYYDNYNDDQAVADSIADVQTGLAIVQDLVFRQLLPNAPGEKYLETTTGSEIFDPASHFMYCNQAPASNGIMYLTSNLNYDNVATWNKMLEVECEWQDNRKPGAQTTIYNRSVSADNVLFDSISEAYYIEVVNNRASAQPSVVFTIPQVLACEYDIYVYVVPGIVTDTLNIESTRLQFTLRYMDTDGKKKSVSFKDDEFLTSPTEYKCIKVTKDAPFKFPVANYYDMLWLLDPTHNSNNCVFTTEFTIQTNVSNTEYNKNELVRKFRLDRILFVPIKK